MHAQAADFVAAGAIVFSAFINIRGVQVGAAIAGASTIAKFGALAALVAASFLLGGGHGATLDHFAPSGATVNPGLFGLALISVLWAYDGFADSSFAAGEVKDRVIREPVLAQLERAKEIGRHHLLAVEDVRDPGVVEHVRPEVAQRPPNTYQKP